MISLFTTGLKAAQILRKKLIVMTRRIPTARNNLGAVFGLGFEVPVPKGKCPLKPDMNWGSKISWKIIRATDRTSKPGSSS
jgi:hypothetical protein